MYCLLGRFDAAIDALFGGLDLLADLGCDVVEDVLLEDGVDVKVKIFYGCEPVPHVSLELEGQMGGEVEHGPELRVESGEDLDLE